MFLSVIYIIVGFACLIFGANWLVDGASSLARKYKVSDLAIGLTIVAFGTSAPELIVNIISSAEGHSDIVLGNIIGSNNLNLFLILGVSGIILPITVQSSSAWREIPISLGITVLFLFLANNFFVGSPSFISRIDGIILLMLFLLFLYYISRQMKTDQQTVSEPVQKSTYKIILLIIIGMAGLIFGGKIVIKGSIDIAHQLDVSEKIIGLTIVAAGTSLPELVTSIVAAIKKNSDIAIGNVIGSNIFNILLILSISSFVRPVAFNTKFNIDMFILIGGTIFLFTSMLTGKRKRLDRWEAAILLSFYLIYTVYLVTNE